MNFTALSLGIQHSNINQFFERRTLKTGKLGKCHDDNESHQTKCTSLQPGNYATNFFPVSEYAEGRKEQAAHLQARKQPCHRR